MFSYLDECPSPNSSVQGPPAQPRQSPPVLNGLTSQIERPPSVGIVKHRDSGFCDQSFPNGLTQYYEPTVINGLNSSNRTFLDGLPHHNVFTSLQNGLDKSYEVPYNATGQYELKFEAQTHPSGMSGLTFETERNLSGMSGLTYTEPEERVFSRISPTKEDTKGKGEKQQIFFVGPSKSSC